MKTEVFWTDDFSPEIIPGENSELPAEVDVAIVGSGYTGLNCARVLVKAGMSVAVMDQHAIGWGASSRNGGMATPGLKQDIFEIKKMYGMDYAREFWQSSMDAINLLEQIIVDENIACNWERNGHCSLAYKQSHFDELPNYNQWLKDEFGHEKKLVPKEELKIESNEIMLLSVCRFNKIKGIDTLIEAFSILNQKYKIETKVKLVIIGRDDGYANVLRNLIKNNQFNSGIIMLEDKSREFIISSYHACDFFLIPSYYETGPCTILEAFVCKKPVIGSNVGGIPELMKDGETGFLIEKGNSSELVEKLSLLFSNLEKSKEMGGKGRIFVMDNFNLDKICNDFLNHLKKYAIGDI